MADQPTDTRPPGRSGQDDDRSIGELFSAISADLSTLIRQEVDLAKAEVKQSATQAGAGAGMLAGSGFAAYMVLLFLSVSGWWGLGRVIGNAWSALVVAAVWAVIAAVLYAMGRSKLRSVDGIPRTTQTAKQVPTALAGNEEKA